MAIQKHRSNTSKAKSQGSNATQGVGHGPAPRGKNDNFKRYGIVAALVVASFFGAYQFARAQSGSGPATANAASVGSGSSSGVAQTQGGVQKVSVDVGFKYTPDVIRLKAGVPAEITFSQAQGCTAVVQSSELGFQEDLSSGPKTVKLGGLQPGTYGFACGMNMVRGQIVVS